MGRFRLLGILAIVALPFILMVGLATAQESPALVDVEALGKAVFFDERLSIDENQSCASCHAPEAGWVGPTSGVNAGGSVYMGSISGRFGDRKPPSAAYATPSGRR